MINQDGANSMELISMRLGGNEGREDSKKGEGGPIEILSLDFVSGAIFDFCYERRKYGGGLKVRV